jgi:hypothetical protein
MRVIPLLRKANSAIRNLFEFGEIVAETSDLHSRKHDSQITSSEGGKSIDIKPVLEKADLSIRDNLESTANMIQESSVHLEKPDLPMTSKDGGIQMDFRPTSEQAICDKIEPASNARETGRGGFLPQNRGPVLTA